MDVGPIRTRVGAAELLTDQEREVLALVAEGHSNVAIGDELALSTRTVERHLSNIYRKLGLSGRSARVAAAARLHGMRRVGGSRQHPG